MSGYDDIIDVTWDGPRRHRHMAVGQRAAQFMPFAALSGYDDLLEQVARRPEERVELDEDAREQLDRQLCGLRQMAERHPRVSVIHFRDDARQGGGYVQTDGEVARVDVAGRCLVLVSGERIDWCDIVRIAM
ncbi:hypothetical protein [Bifidobacterium cuniculi]|uniref:DNA-repair protein n=1 Tax=Bifidobacterium cuniculi TaxID=1688 RepID=A0A087AT47_9BIFI|nr:hypothetical protein [Bifidobacterium cuniculi]KFI61947.1 DNA-repair protein [Bifidobacterium cuniculi]